MGMPTGTLILSLSKDECGSVRRESADQPRPMNGICVAMMVMNWTLDSSGRSAI